MFYNMGEVLSDQFDHFKLIFWGPRVLKPNNLRIRSLKHLSLVSASDIYFTNQDAMARRSEQPSRPTRSRFLRPRY